MRVTWEPAGVRVVPHFPRPAALPSGAPYRFFSLQFGCHPAGGTGGLVAHFLKLCAPSWWTFQPLRAQIPGPGSVSEDWDPRGWNSGYATLNVCGLSTLLWRLG